MGCTTPKTLNWGIFIMILNREDTQVFPHIWLNAAEKKCSYWYSLTNVDTFVSRSQSSLTLGSTCSNRPAVIMQYMSRITVQFASNLFGISILSMNPLNNRRKCGIKTNPRQKKTLLILLLKNCVKLILWHKQHHFCSVLRRLYDPSFLRILSCSFLWLLLHFSNKPSRGNTCFGCSCFLISSNTKNCVTEGLKVYT